MHSCCTLFLTKTDSTHLNNAAFVFGKEVCMRFNSVYNNNSGCTVSIFIKVYGSTVFSISEIYRLHIRTDFTAHCFLAYAVFFKDMNLSVCCCSSMAAHCRNNERLSAVILDIINGSLNDFIDIVYTS